MAVIAVGDFDPAAIEALVRKHFAGIPARTASVAAAELSGAASARHGLWRRD